MKKLLTILLLWSGIAHAEWVNFPGFSGTVTRASSSNLGFDHARKAHSVLFRTGEMEKLAIDWRNTRPVIGLPIDWMAKSPSSSHFFYSVGGGVRYYNVDIDTSTRVGVTATDSVNTTSGDSTATRSSVLSPSQWLKLTLTGMETVKIGDSVYSIEGFYNSKKLQLSRGAYSTATNALMSLSRSVSSASGPPGSFIANDTAWFADGDFLHYFLGDSSVSISYPTYAYFGVVDSLVKVWNAGCTNNRCDTVYAYGNFPDSILNDILDFYFLFDVDTFPRGIPTWSDAAFNIGGGTERIRLILDTAYYKHWDTTGERVVDGSRCVAFRPGAYHAFNQYDYLYQDTGKWDYRATHGNVAYGLWTPNNPGQYFLSVREYDCRMMRPGIWSSGARIANTLGYSSQCRIVKENDTLKLLVFDKAGTIHTSDVTTTTLQMYENPCVAMSGAGSIAWDWRIAALHRQRVFWSGGDTGNAFAWSNLEDYDSFGGEEYLEGPEDVTAITSNGQEAAIYRERSILGLSGFDENDFYLVPTPSGVGAVNNATVERDPLSNTDYFFNDQGVFQSASGSVSEVPTACPEIFSDSINWSRKAWFDGVVYNRKYVIAVAFGSSLANNRLIFVDLESGDVSFQYGINPGCLYVHRVPGSVERLFVGDADSTRIVEMAVNGTDEIRTTSDWRSGWYDGGDRALLKRGARYQIGYESDANDTLFVDFYTNFSETAVATKTIVASAGGNKTFYGFGPNKWMDEHLAIGIRMSDPSVKIVRADIDVVPVGRGRGQP